MKIANHAIAYAIALVVSGAVAPAFADDDSSASIKTYGAAGDGRQDDTQAFRQALASVKAGGTILLPPGNYTFSDTIVISKPVKIVGQGFTTQLYNKSGKTLFSFRNVQNASLRDVYLGSNATVSGTALIELINSHRNRFDNVTMLGGYYGVHLNGSLLNTFIDLRSGINIQGFFAPVSVNQAWVFGDRNYAVSISANANTFVAPVLEGGTNGIIMNDAAGEGSIHITGGTIEGVSGVGLTFNGTTLPSSVTGVHFEANGTDILINAANNIRIASVLSTGLIRTVGDSRDISITDTMAQSISLDMGDNKYPLGTGAKRILLQNITTCIAPGSSISPAPTTDPEFGQPNGPSSPIIPNALSGQGSLRKDIVYLNIGYACGGG
jgi:hypothetical protein